MKALTLALLLSLPAINLQPGAAASPAVESSGRAPPERRTLVFRRHRPRTVYCYGPVMTVPSATGDLQKVATFCRDGSAVVPLKD